MIFWIAAGSLTALVVAGLLLPLLRRPRATADRAVYDLAVYKDQLAEIDRDLARGEIGVEQAAAAKTEVERRLLAVGQAASAAEQSAPAARPSTYQAAAIGLAVVVPALAVGAYLWLGVPGAPSQPFAERRTTADADAQADPAMAQLAERLAARLAAAPNDRNGWLLLARTYGALGRFADTARAYGQAIENGFDDAEMHAAKGEALTAAADGTVTPEARQDFAAALERDPAEPRARYYGGVALAQDGRVREAMKVWMALLREAPPEATWRDFIAGQIRQAAAALGEPPPPEAAEAAPAPPAAGAPGPSQADIDTAGQMSAEDRIAFVRSMVARLATRMQEQPDDLDGWLRLARAYAVLGEPARAAEAVARAEALVRDLPAEAPERAAVEAARKALPAAD
ncbi:MAG TPA: c-type cytochrome biogenesis protein CcmI [Kiloniellales bacterium]